MDDALIPLPEGSDIVCDAAGCKEQATWYRPGRIIMQLCLCERHKQVYEQQRQQEQSDREA